MKIELLEQLKDKRLIVTKSIYDDKVIWSAWLVEESKSIILSIKDREKPKEDVKPLPSCDSDCIHATTIGEGTELICRKFPQQKIGEAMKCNSYEPFSKLWIYH